MLSLARKWSNPGPEMRGVNIAATRIYRSRLEKPFSTNAQRWPRSATGQIWSCAVPSRFEVHRIPQTVPSLVPTWCFAEGKRLRSMYELFLCSEKGLLSVFSFELKTFTSSRSALVSCHHGRYVASVRIKLLCASFYLL